MFKYETFKSEFKLELFIHVRKIERKNIESIIYNPTTERYVLFYWANVDEETGLTI